MRSRGLVFNQAQVDLRPYKIKIQHDTHKYWTEGLQN